MSRLAAVVLGVLLAVAPCLAEEPPIPRPRPSPASADVQIGPFLLPAGAPADIILTGAIEDDAPSQFLRAFRARPGAKRLLLSSQGGRVDPALIVAKEVHERGLETRIPVGSGCYSACAFIFLAGTTRSVANGGALGVHQIYGSPDPAAVQVTFSDVFDTLREFGVPDRVISQMLRTPPDGMYAFTREELVTFGIVTDVSAEITAPVSELHTAETEALPLVESADPAASPGTQSLLLEASDDGTTGAVPFSGTVEWSKGTDEMGLPTLIGKANIPARNLAVDVLIRKNSDGSLPASHLMEVNFRVSDSFVGGSIAGLAGVLLKNEELVQGTALVGYSERMRPNTFTFALRSSDRAANRELLTASRWMDLALLYDSGRRAILTLGLDEQAAQGLLVVVAEEPYVQLSAQPNYEDARQVVQTTRQRLAEVLPDATYVIRPITLPGKGPWFRIGVSAPSFTAAVALCSRLKSVGVDCVPLRD